MNRDYKRNDLSFLFDSTLTCIEYSSFRLSCSPNTHPLDLNCSTSHSTLFGIDYDKRDRYLHLERKWDSFQTASRKLNSLYYLKRSIHLCISNICLWYNRLFFEHLEHNLYIHHLFGHCSTSYWWICSLQDIQCILFYYLSMFCNEVKDKQCIHLPVSRILTSKNNIDQGNMLSSSDRYFDT